MFTDLLDRSRSQAIPMICIRYLLFIPHWFTNVASPLIGVPFFLFLWTTMLSSIPGTALYTCAGAGLATVFEARERAAAAGEAAGEMPSTTDVLLSVVMVDDPVQQALIVGFASMFVLIPLGLWCMHTPPPPSSSEQPLPGMAELERNKDS